MSLMQFWKKGFAFIMIFIVLYLLMDFSQSFKPLLGLFIPKSLLFFGGPFLIIFVVGPLIIGAIASLINRIILSLIELSKFIKNIASLIPGNGTLGALIRKLVSFIPFFTFYRKEEIIRRGVPVVKSGEDGYLYGFAMGINKINGEPVVNTFFPTTPFVLTGYLIGIRIVGLKKAEIVGKSEVYVIKYFIKQMTAWGTPQEENLILKDLRSKEVEEKQKKAL